MNQQLVNNDDDDEKTVQHEEEEEEPKLYVLKQRLNVFILVTLPCLFIVILFTNSLFAPDIRQYWKNKVYYRIFQRPEMQESDLNFPLQIQLVGLDNDENRKVIYTHSDYTWDEFLELAVKKHLPYYLENHTKELEYIYESTKVSSISILNHLYIYHIKKYQIDVFDEYRLDGEYHHPFFKLRYSNNNIDGITPFDMEIELHENGKCCNDGLYFKIPKGSKFMDILLTLSWGLPQDIKSNITKIKMVKYFSSKFEINNMDSLITFYMDNIKENNIGLNATNHFPFFNIMYLKDATTDTLQPGQQMGSIPPPIIDKHERCNEWANWNPSECDLNRKWMNANCAKSCQVDKHWRCPIWAAQIPSECDLNRKWMNANCAKSCNQIEDKISSLLTTKNPLSTTTTYNSNIDEETNDDL